MTMNPRMEKTPTRKQAAVNLAKSFPKEILWWMVGYWMAVITQLIRG